VTDARTVVCLGLVLLGIVPTLASFAQFLIVGLHGIWNQVETHLLRLRPLPARHCTASFNG